ncbi:MAG: DNA adenine methylase [Prevotella sp.]|nr:DNA adenine methylase [Prevotella sp.]
MRYPNFDNISVDNGWAFSSVRSIERWTHGYHRYPAKFLPDVVKRLIESYAGEGKTVADPFAGCGTTLVEAKIHGCKSIGTDINPIAVLITKVKTTPIEPDDLEKHYSGYVAKFKGYDRERFVGLKVHERLDYWFREEEKGKIAYLYQLASEESDTDIKDFFLVAISHILKSCSWWLQSSTKAQKDPNKNIQDPFLAFKQHCTSMIKGNKQFYNELSKKRFIDIECNIRLSDARHTELKDESADVIITSPPYVTSYEYADIHQLTGYWMNYFSDITKFRRPFIGTSYSGNKSIDIQNSFLGKKIVNELYGKEKKLAFDVANYFNDILAVSYEMARILRPGGVACVVIGNTTLRNVHVKSAEVLYGYLCKAGFMKVEVIKRNIPFKLMPTLRDEKTGKFTTMENRNCKKVYPDEFIIIMKKK